MILSFVNKQRRYSAEKVKNYQEICSRVMEAVASRPFLDKRMLKSGIVLSATVNFVGTDKIRLVNREFRSINKVTDVLTFPLLDMKTGKLVSPLTDSDFVLHDDVKELPLGEILISLEKAEEQSEEYGHSMEREVAFLTAHATLHLLGFDHMEPKEEKKMITEQERVLNELGITREGTTEAAAGSAKATAGISDTEEEKDDVSARDWHKLILHSGFVAIIGRPNVGKSTLLNRISGMKLAIVSAKPQTTRKNIRSILNTDDAQVIFVDTPGLHRPKSGLAEFMVNAAFRAAQDADMILMLADATKGWPSPIEREACKKAGESHKKVILAINKADAVAKESLLPIIAQYYSLFQFEAIIPISAQKGDGIDELLKEITSRLPAGPRYFPIEDITDQSERTLAAELIREQILHYTNQEIPHGTAVEIIKFEEHSSGDATDEYDREQITIHASIICERDSHKAILLGKNGQMIKRIGTRARENIEKMCGCKVYLDLHVKVRADWKNKPAFLEDLGYKKED